MLEHTQINWLPLDLESNESIATLANDLAAATPSLDLVLFCSGWLHDENCRPEKSMKELSAAAFSKAMRINATAPLLLVAQLESLVVRASAKVPERCRIVFLSAKVGSISDNGLGGWHAYRMSKAALNMGVRNLGIEFSRSKRKPIAVAVHPGTTHSALSRPFATSRLPVVDTEITADRLGAFVESINDERQGKFYHWDGAELPY